MRTRNADKEQLVKQKALELLVSDGLEGFSVNKLARACNISVATLYIYYKDKEDLITQLGMEEGKRMTDMMLQDFDPAVSFADGLRMQWKNRAKYMLAHPLPIQFLEQLRSSTYQHKITEAITDDLRNALGTFITNAVTRGEISKMPIEVYWSVAFAPLYALLRFHNEGKSIGGKPFSMNDDQLWQTFDLVIKAFKPL